MPDTKPITCPCGRCEQTKNHSWTDTLTQTERIPRCPACRAMLVRGFSPMPIPDEFVATLRLMMIGSDSACCGDVETTAVVSKDTTMGELWEWWQVQTTDAYATTKGAVAITPAERLPERGE